MKTWVVDDVGDGRIENEKERDGEEMGNHPENVELKRISCVSQYTISYTAGTPLCPMGNTTHTTSSNHNQASRTTDFSYRLISSILFSHSTPSLFVVHNSTVIAEHKVKSSLSCFPCHEH
jgi:hypothetical protein